MLLFLSDLRQVISDYSNVAAERFSAGDRRRAVLQVRSLSGGKDEIQRLETERKERVIQRAEEKIQNAVGFRKLMQALSDSKKLVGFLFFNRMNICISSLPIL